MLGRYRSIAIAIIGLALGAPFSLAHAQERTLTTIIQSFIDLIEYAIPIVMVLAVLTFFFGVARFIFSAESDQARAEGKWFLLWGVIGLFVMVAIWGIVLVIQDTFFV